MFEMKHKDIGKVELSYEGIKAIRASILACEDTNSPAESNLDVVDDLEFINEGSDSILDSAAFLTLFGFREA